MVILRASGMLSTRISLVLDRYGCMDCMVMAPVGSSYSTSTVSSQPLHQTRGHQMMMMMMMMMTTMLTVPYQSSLEPSVFQSMMASPPSTTKGGRPPKPGLVTEIRRVN
jgi:hypothetical protein